MNPKVNFFFDRAGKWREAFVELRSIVLDCGLNETLKWGQACYVHNDRNIVLIHGFKDYCALLFFKGALLTDPRHLLIQQTRNVQAARQIRFTTVPEIVKMRKVLKAYIHEAIDVEQKGLKVDMKKTSDFKIPEEFQEALDKRAALKKAFHALTPGRQRAYIFYISSAKLAATRTARVEKCIPKILSGNGLND